MKALNSKTFLLNEGLEDRSQIIEGRAVIAAQETSLSPHQKARRRAKWKAKRIGLVYWPALIGAAIDPNAFLVAEEVLLRHHSAWGTKGEDGTLSHGGWDSQGHWGISAQHVEKAWYASGCRDSAKFRWLIAAYRPRDGWLVQPRKGDSVQDLQWMEKGARHLRVQQVCDLPGRVSRKTLRFLGRVSSQCREALLTAIQLPEGAGEAPRNRRIRIRDLNFAQAALLATAPSGRRSKWDALKTAEHREMASGPLSLDWYQRYYAPGFRGASVEHAKALGRGVPPAKLIPEAISRKEAHEALTSVVYLESGWMGFLAIHLGHGQTVRSDRVSRWLGVIHSTGRWNKMEATRVAHGPAGQAREFRFLDILDEVQDEDIVNGRDRVEDVFDRASTRLAAASEGNGRDDHLMLCQVPDWLKGKSYITPLVTPAALRREGRQMHHCVAGYAESTQRGQSICFGISTPDGRSTVEVARDGSRVFQHKGVRNATPPDANNKLLEELLVAARTRHAS